MITIQAFQFITIHMTQCSWEVPMPNVKAQRILLNSLFGLNWMKSSMISFVSLYSKNSTFHFPLSSSMCHYFVWFIVTTFLGVVGPSVLIYEVEFKVLTGICVNINFTFMFIGHANKWNEQSSNYTDMFKNAYSWFLHMRDDWQD